jgi:hypothetical protein
MSPGHCAAADTVRLLACQAQQHTWLRHPTAPLALPQHLRPATPAAHSLQHPLHPSALLHLRAVDGAAAVACCASTPHTHRHCAAADTVLLLAFQSQQQTTLQLLCCNTWLYVPPPPHTTSIPSRLPFFSCSIHYTLQPSCIYGLWMALLQWRAVPPLPTHIDTVQLLTLCDRLPATCCESTQHTWLHHPPADSISDLPRLLLVSCSIHYTLQPPCILRLWLALQRCAVPPHPWCSPRRAAVPLPCSIPSGGIHKRLPGTNMRRIVTVCTSSVWLQ